MWQAVGGDVQVRYVSIGIDGQIWAVRNDGVPMMRTDVNDEQPEGTGWMEVSNSDQHRMEVMEVGECQIWATDEHYQIWRRRGCTQLPEANPMGDSWEQEPGMLMHVSVGYGPMLWGVDPWNDVWYKMIGLPKWEDRETSDDWIKVDVKMTYLDVGKNGHVWALNNQGELFWREGVTVENIVGTEFVQKQYPATHGTFTGLGYCTDGHIWAMNGQGQLFFKDGITQTDLLGDAGTWTQDTSASVDENMAAQITCGYRGQFAMVTTQGQMMVKNLVNYADPMGL
jgi:hypothetical protein